MQLRTRLAHSRVGRLFSRFAAGSAVAAGCSQLAFLLLYGLTGASAAVSGALAFLAGAVPNFLLQRYWTWKRAGRIGVRGELLPYLGVIAFNALVATGATAGTDRLIGGAIDDHALRTVLLTVAFTGSYLLLFVVKFVLLDRLVFGAATRREERSRHQVPTITRA
ncbi:MAG: GtrA family protein [Pseudonocardiaceae bacterium]